MKYKLLAFSFFAMINSFAIYGQTTGEIKNIFKKFQEGYSKRDTSRINSYTEDLCSPEIQIIGTGPTERLHGIAAAKDLFRNDWLFWFTLSLDTANLDVAYAGNAAFFMVSGTASMTFPNKNAAYDFAIGRLRQLVDPEKTSRSKLLAYSSQAAEMVEQIERGSLEIKYLIRLSGGLVWKDNKWLFTQLNFSFPYPMTRK